MIALKPDPLPPAGMDAPHSGADVVVRRVDGWAYACAAVRLDPPLRNAQREAMTCARLAQEAATCAAAAVKGESRSHGLTGGVARVGRPRPEAVAKIQPLPQARREGSDHVQLPREQRHARSSGLQSRRGGGREQPAWGGGCGCVDTVERYPARFEICGPYANKGKYCIWYR